MNETKTPRGVTFSYLIMTFPLFIGTTALLLSMPQQEIVFNFGNLARTMLRVLSLQIAFQGGIHYGLAAACYETTVDDEESKRVKY